MERAPQTLVIDASAAAKWFIPKEDTDKALMLRNKHIEGGLTLMAPDLLVYEGWPTPRFTIRRSRTKRSKKTLRPSSWWTLNWFLRQAS